MCRLQQVIAELKRRRVLRALLGWGLVSFAVLQVVEPLIHALHLPDWALTAVVAVLALGFPISVVLAWFFDLTRSGLTRTADASPSGDDVEVPSRRRLAFGLAGLVAASAVLGAGLAGVALRRAEPRPPVDADGRLRVAVADFANDTQDPELDGLSWMLVSSLAESRKLSVVTRTRMVDELRRLGRAPTPVLDEAAGQDAARALGVRRLVLAAVHRLGGTHTIELRVVDPSTGEYVFALQERGEGKGSVQDVIDRVSRRTRERLHAESRDEVQATSARVADVTTANLEAWRHFALGLSRQDSFLDMEALDEFRQAVALDPGFALAHYQIARSLAFLSLSDEERNASLQKAIRGIDRLPARERLMVQALQARGEGRHDDAAALAVRAARDFPQDKDALLLAGELPYWQHRLAEALPWFERAVEIDPVWEPALNRLVDTSVGLGRTEEVVARARRWAEQWPGGVTFRVLSAALRVAGRFPESVDAARSAFELDPVLKSRHDLAVSLVWADRAPEAEQVLRPVFSPGGSAVDRRQAVWALLHALEHQGRHAEATRVLDELPGEPALLWFRFAVLCGGARHRGGSDAADSRRQGIEDGKEILRLGVKVEDLTVCLTMLGAHELAGETARRHPLGPDYLEAIRAWQRGDNQASLAILRRLARNRGPWIRGVNQFWIATVAFDAGLQPEAFDAMAAFEREGSGPWRATGLAELLLAKAAAHERTGERSLAVASVERLLEAWSRADPDLPLLAEARALCRKLGCRERVRPVSAK